MPYESRIRQVAFVENIKLIESDWDVNFGDRKNEIVFIGQNLDKKLIYSHLNECLANDKELATSNWQLGYQDEWPVERAYAL